MLNEKLPLALTYDDLVLVPQYSEVKSRLDVKLDSFLGAQHLKVPLLSSPMDTVTDVNMVNAMNDVGGMGVLHRFMPDALRLEKLVKLRNAVVGFAVGLTDDMAFLKDVAALGFVDCFVIDVAHGDTLEVVSLIKKLKDLVPIVMAGSIVTGEAAHRLIRAGADVLRVGVGGGSTCTTRLVTGFGVPNITAIAEVKKVVDHQRISKDKQIQIVADGGIRTSGDAAKALAAGADFVMLGGVLAGTDEAAGPVVQHGGKLYKEYRGMASEQAQATRGGLKRGTTAEGVSTLVAHRGSVYPILDNFIGGLRSALSYAGATTLFEFYRDTEFMQVTSNGLAEAKPHILGK